MRVESLRSKGSLLVSPSVPREPKESVCPQDTLGPRAPERPAGMSKYKDGLPAAYSPFTCRLLWVTLWHDPERPIEPSQAHYTACCATMQNCLSTSPRTPLNQTPVWAAACFYGFCSERVTERSPPPSASAQPVRSSILPRRV